jgi:hypothetical protein
MSDSVPFDEDIINEDTINMVENYNKVTASVKLTYGKIRVVVPEN